MKTITDFEEGARFALTAPGLSKDDIIAYASQFDPQPMHLDEEAGKQSILGGLAASGWHSISVIQSTLVSQIFKDSAFGGLTGIPELRWQKPVYPDTPFSIEAEIIAREKASDLPGFGLLTLECSMSDQKTGTVLTKATLKVRMGGAA